MLLTELRILIEELEQPDQRHYGARRRETMYSRKGFPTSSGSLSPRGELYYDGQEQSVWCATRRCFMRSTGRRSYSIRRMGTSADRGIRFGERPEWLPRLVRN